MWFIAVAIAFCAGILAGYQLPGWIDAWRAYRRRKTFRLSVLQQYKLTPEGRVGRQDGVRS